MSQYYYLVASLPMLAFDMEPPLSSETLEVLCEEHLSLRDLRIIRAILGAEITSDSGSAAVNRYWLWECALRNRLAVLRAAALGGEPERWLRGCPAALEVEPVLTSIESPASRFLVVGFPGDIRRVVCSGEVVQVYVDVGFPY